MTYQSQLLLDMNCPHLVVPLLSLSVLLPLPTHSLPILTSCSDILNPSWNTDLHTIGPAIHSWLHSLVTVREEEGGVRAESMLYHPSTGEYSDHYAHYNDIMEENNHLVDTDRRVVTIGTFAGTFLLAWHASRGARG